MRLNALQQLNESRSRFATQEMKLLDRIRDLESQINTFHDTVQIEHKQVRDEHEKEIQELRDDLSNLAARSQRGEQIQRVLNEEIATREREIVLQNGVFKNQYKLAVRTLRASFKAQVEEFKTDISANFEEEKEKLAEDHQKKVQELLSMCEEETRQKNDRVKAEHKTEMRMLQHNFGSTVNRIQATHNFKLGQLKERLYYSAFFFSSERSFTCVM
ncbi:hypothetical protein V5O48_009787 [Marasmius crinis-equi]|uniref:Uncharacterized protein n=1 Tax=Marasmius crinis-equi TaxID=585013 RepID=A0ABR3FA78_9AGAR